MSVFENKNRTRNSTSVWLWVSPPRPPAAIPKSFRPVPSIYRAILVNIPPRRKNQEKKPQATPPSSPTLSARTRTMRGVSPRGGTVSTSQVIAILPGAARPAPLRSGPPSRWQDSHWEDGAEGGPRRGREAGCREVPEREEAVLGAQCRPLGHSARLRRDGILKVVGGPSSHTLGGGGGAGSKLCSCCCHLAGRAPSKDGAGSPPLPCRSAQSQKRPAEKGDSFLSKKGLLKETTDCKLPSLL